MASLFGLLIIWAVYALIVLAVSTSGGMRRRRWLEFFTEHMATVTEMALPIPQALEMLASDIAGAFGGVAEDMADRVRAGALLSDAMMNHRSVFPMPYIAIVRACELNGNLKGAFEHLRGYCSTPMNVRRSLIGIVAYLAMIATVSGGIISGLCVLIVPKFEMMFKEMGMELPAITRAVFGAVAIVGKVFFDLCVVLVLVLLLMYVLSCNWRFRELLGRVFAWVPGFRLWRRYMSEARVARALQSMLEVGVPLPDALRAASDVPTEWWYRMRLGKAGRLVSNGRPLGEALTGARVHPLLRWLAAVGEQSGHLPQAMAQAAAIFEGRAEFALRCAARLIMPCGVLCVASINGLLILAFFLPLIKLAGCVT